MNPKELLALSVAAMGLGGLLMVTPARSQAAAPQWSSRTAPVTLPVERASPRGSEFTPPAPRGNLRGDIAANSRGDRGDRNTPNTNHREPGKPARR